MREPLLDHQRTGIAWLSANDDNKLLADEPGLGKSRQAIEATDGGRNLVIAPAMVLDGGTWTDEINAWSDFPDRWTQASYTSLNKREILPTGGNRPIPGVPRDEFAGPWDAIVVDEAHYTKNRGTNWTETIEAMAKKSGITIEMTGTPISHWANDLFPTLCVLHPDEARPGRRFGSYWRWVEQWFDVQPSRFGGPNSRVVGDLAECDKSCLLREAWDPCEHYIDFARANLGDQFLRRLREDCLDLPPISIAKIRTPMEREQSRLYRELKKDFAVVAESGEAFEAWSNGSKVTMMMRLTTSGWFLDKKGEPRGGKLENLRADLRDRTRPTLVLAHFRDTVDACAVVADSTGASVATVHGGTGKSERLAAVRSFQSGKLDVLVGSLEVVAEGLNLTAADAAIFVELSFKPSRNKQARDRIHRLGQTRPVTVREYVTPLTIDENKYALLKTKTDRQMRMMSAASFLELM